MEKVKPNVYYSQTSQFSIFREALSTFCGPKCLRLQFDRTKTIRSTTCDKALSDTRKLGGVSVALLAGIKLAAWSENVLKLQLNRIWESVSVSFDSTALLILYKYKKQHQGTIEGRNLVTYFEGADNNLGARGNFIFRKLNV